MNSIQTESPTPRFIRPHQWEAITGMSIWAAYRALKAGTLRGVKIGSSWYIETSEIEDFWTRHKAAA